MKDLRVLVALFIVSGFGTLTLHAQPVPDLTITVNDLRIEQSIEGGYYLYVRKKPDIASVMLTESTEDPQRKEASYALRNPVYHPENGDEKRKLDGKFLDPKDRYSLIDSTPIEDKELGQAFRIFIPYIVIFGYPDKRYGEIQVFDGVYLSVRTFPLPFGDYDKGFKDNPFVMRLTQNPLKGPPEGNYMPDTVKTYTEIAESNQGKVWYSKGEDDLLRSLEEVLRNIKTDELDLVLCLDATKSMENDAPFLRQKLVPLLNEYTKSVKNLRVGLVQYRDYLEDFLYKITPFQSNFAAIQTAIDRYTPAGGRDIPEAVNEALFAALKEYDWKAKARLVILVGDAPPHPIPRGSVTQEMVGRSAKEKGVSIHAIILPQ